MKRVLFLCTILFISGCIYEKPINGKIIGMRDNELSYYLVVEHDDSTQGSYQVHYSVYRAFEVGQQVNLITGDSN